MPPAPEAFLIFKEELKKERIEKERLSKAYEEKIMHLKQEMGYLSEQIGAQQEMIKTTINYATRLEEKLTDLDKSMEKGKKNAKGSFH
ncbi:MAG: hypothetical protein RIF33_26635 [Cyclobacteriaceae bacterium]